MQNRPQIGGHTPCKLREINELVEQQKRGVDAVFRRRVASANELCFITVEQVVNGPTQNPSSFKKNKIPNVKILRGLFQTSKVNVYQFLFKYIGHPMKAIEQIRAVNYGLYGCIKNMLSRFYGYVKAFHDFFKRGDGWVVLFR